MPLFTDGHLSIFANDEETRQDAAASHFERTKNIDAFERMKTRRLQELAKLDEGRASSAAAPLLAASSLSDEYFSRRGGRGRTASAMAEIGGTPASQEINNENSFQAQCGVGRSPGADEIGPRGRSRRRHSVAHGGPSEFSLDDQLALLQNSGEGDKEHSEARSPEAATSPPGRIKSGGSFNIGIGAPLAAKPPRLDRRYLEHDAFALFSLLMTRLYRFFTSAAPPTQEEPQGGETIEPAAPLPQEDHRSWLSAIEKGFMSMAHSISHAVHLPREVAAMPEGAKTMHHHMIRIFDQLLRRHDPQLHSHLRRYDIMPQLFLLRWIRVLFIREFTLEQVCVLLKQVQQNRRFAMVKSPRLTVEYFCSRGPFSGVPDLERCAGLHEARGVLLRGHAVLHTAQPAVGERA